MPCSDCKDERGVEYDAAGRLDWSELPAALAESVRRSMDPKLEAFQQLLRMASPVRVQPADRASTTRIVFPSTDVAASARGALLVPSEPARLRVTISVSYLTIVSGIAAGQQLVDFYASPDQVGSQTSGFALTTGGSSAGTNSNGISPGAILTLPYSGPLFVAMRSQVADPGAGPVLVSAFCEYADLTP